MDIEFIPQRADDPRYSPRYWKATGIEVERVIYNPPATIVCFKGGAKCVVKCAESSEFDKRVGLLSAIAKKALGESFHRTMREWAE